MRTHLSSPAKGFFFKAGLGIKLCKKLLNRCQPRSKPKGLVAVVTRAKITGLEKFSHCHLGHLFTIAEDAKLGFTSEHFLASKQAGFPADTGPTVITQHFVPEFIEG